MIHFLFVGHTQKRTFLDIGKKPLKYFFALIFFFFFSYHPSKNVVFLNYITIRKNINFNKSNVDKNVSNWISVTKCIFMVLWNKNLYHKMCIFIKEVLIFPKSEKSLRCKLVDVGRKLMQMRIMQIYACTLLYFLLKLAAFDIPS